MLSDKRQAPAGLTRIGLNELEVRQWRGRFHTGAHEVPVCPVKPAPNARAIDVKLKVAARTAFAKMGED
jgi:hypothetical protein